jgi:hypothetical protein
MYKPSLVDFYRRRNGKLLEGKNTVLLAKDGDKIYRVQEHIGLVVKIYPKLYGDTIPKLLVRFADGKEYQVRAYLDTNIEENTIVSIYGIFVETSTKELEFICKGGMVRVFGELVDAGRVNTKYVYRFGFGELSKVKKSPRYPSNLEGIEVLEENKLWTYSGTDIEEIENTEEGIFEEEDTTIDFKSGDKFYIDNETRYVERINY